MIDLDAAYLKYLAEYMCSTPEDVLNMIFDQYEEDIKLVDHEPNKYAKDAFTVLAYKPIKERPSFTDILKQMGVIDDQPPIP